MMSLKFNKRGQLDNIVTLLLLIAGIVAIALAILRYLHAPPFG